MIHMMFTGETPNGHSTLEFSADLYPCEVLEKFDRFVELMQREGVEHWTCYMTSAPDAVIQRFRSRLEFLDMIYTVNAYSRAHNGAKIYM